MKVTFMKKNKIIITSLILMASSFVSAFAAEQNAVESSSGANRLEDGNYATPSLGLDGPYGCGIKVTNSADKLEVVLTSISNPLSHMYCDTDGEVIGQFSWSDPSLISIVDNHSFIANFTISSSYFDAMSAKSVPYLFSFVSTGPITNLKFEYVVSSGFQLGVNLFPFQADEPIDQVCAAGMAASNAHVLQDCEAVKGHACTILSSSVLASGNLTEQDYASNGLFWDPRTSYNYDSCITRSIAQ